MNMALFDIYQENIGVVINKKVHCVEQWTTHILD